MNIKTQYNTGPNSTGQKPQPTNNEDIHLRPTLKATKHLQISERCDKSLHYNLSLDFPPQNQSFVKILTNRTLASASVTHVKTILMFSLGKKNLRFPDMKNFGAPKCHKRLEHQLLGRMSRENEDVRPPGTASALRRRPQAAAFPPVHLSPCRRAGGLAFPRGLPAHSWQRRGVSSPGMGAPLAFSAGPKPPDHALARRRAHSVPPGGDRCAQGSRGWGRGGCLRRSRPQGRGPVLPARTVHRSPAS